MESTWIRRLGRSASGVPPLVCFPHAGGSAGVYRPLARALAPEVEVVAVQYPGRMDRHRDASVESITGLAELIAAELEARMDRPYALFGHSMGASVAYETARLVESGAGPGPVRLFLSGRSAPAERVPRGGRLLDDAELLAELRRLGGTGRQVLENPLLLEMVLPALRADYAALRSYSWRPGPPLGCPFTVLVGESDPLVAVDEAAGWLEHSSARGEFHTFSGGHFYLNDHVDALAGVVSAALAAAPTVDGRGCAR